MAQRDDKLNFTYRCSMATAGVWKVELYLPLFNSPAEWKVELYLQLFNGTAVNEMKSWTLLTAVQ